MLFLPGMLPGLLLVLSAAVPAWFLGKEFPLIGGPVFAILLGMLFSLARPPAICRTGIQFSAKKLLQASIILFGFEMNLYQVYRVGSQSLSIMVFTLSAAFLAAWLAGRYLKLDGNTSILIGVGTAICGGSAIAATAPVIAADDKEIAYSISTIFLFNIAAVLLFPFLGHRLGMNDMGFGMWAGTAINDTSSVVAAGYSYSNAAGNFATIVKLTRTLMIIPVTLFLSAMTARKNAAKASFRFSKVFPWFIVAFIAASVLRTWGIVPLALCSLFSQTGKFFIIMAMAAIGLNTPLRQMVANGIRPLLLGLSCWVAVATVSLAVQSCLKLW
jgi:uncharacterized integral membrane protein (TIGR00698 family)